MDNVGKEDYLALEDDQLWQQCKMETYRASGPGGQHRNKVDSAVRVIHKPTGTVASATGKRTKGRPENWFESIQTALT